MEKLISSDEYSEQIRKIKSRINKEYFEYYAKFSLITSVDKKYSYLCKDESPDWQSDKLSIGIEVTRAIDKDIYLAYNMINEYFGNVFMSNHISEKIEESQRKHSLLLHSDDDSIDCGDIFNIDNLKKRYIHKTLKLNKNYAQYSLNHLYMFTFKSMDENEVRQCFEVDLSRYKVNFDICFVNCFDRLYVCDFVMKDILYSIDMDSETLKKIKKKALRKSHLE